MTLSVSYDASTHKKTAVRRNGYCGSIQDLTWLASAFSVQMQMGFTGIAGIEAIETGIDRIFDDGFEFGR